MAEFTKEQAAKEAADFLKILADEAIKREIPPQIVVSLFGLFSRHILDGLMESGKSQADAISEIAGMYMKGLGVKTLFKHVHVPDDEGLSNIH